ncbi:MAG TPA: hypothetical protein VKE51_04770 [Vicinamibacterales bacterium]|nr:hypothetical protein [Vicinamibacterales bacterium]
MPALRLSTLRVLLVCALVGPLLSGAIATVAKLSAQQTRVDPALYGGLRWRMIGPFRGGRVNGVSGVPGQPSTFYFGSVGGGVWKTTNAGRTWQPIFDSQPIASIGAIGVAPSRPDVVYVGTGEADMRSQISYGNGMYKSSDAGKTWTHLGLDDTRQIGKVIVDPANPDVVFVAALGHAYGPNPDRGVFRSRDGGATWQKVLFKSNDVGAIDLAFDPADSQIVYASLWNTRRPPWSIYPPSYGPGSGVYKSTDGGSNWQQLTRGLPTDGVGRIGLAVAPASRTRVYAIVDAKEGGLFRSDDGGATWTKTSGDSRIWGRGWYFGKVVVDPKNADLVYVSNTGVYRSRDGGRTFGEPFKGSPGGDDYHQLWIYPDDGNRMILGGDQGAVISVDGLAEHPTWSSWLNQPTAQIYRLAPDSSFPYWVTGAQQDSGAVRVRTRGRFAGITMRDWEPLCAGGEAGYTAPDPLNPDIVYGGTVERCNAQTGRIDRVSPEVDLPTPPRHTWTLPLVFSPADPHALYFSDQYLFKTTDGAQHWTRISEDMTRENPGVPPNLDAATAADAPESQRRGVIYAISPSPLRAPVIWIGTDDGYVHVTPDDGKTWQNVTPRELTAWSKVVMIEASHFDVNSAYAAVDRHRLEDNEPYIYRTKDNGKTWTKITSGLPRGVYVQTVREDPKRRGMLVAGTELGIFVSFDDGDTWQSLQLNLPPSSMRDLAFHDNDLTVATHGRGFWVLDDISALRQLTADVASATVHLFKPAEATILPPATDDGTPTQKDEAMAENPPIGAIVDYYLKSVASGPLTIEILNASGGVVRHVSSADPVPAVNPATLVVNAVWQRPQEPPAAAAGMHRYVWDFRPDPPAGGGRGRGGRGGGGGGGGGRGGPPPVPPGNYSVRLTVNGQSLTQPIVVKPDPREK